MTITPIMQYIQDRILEAVHGCSLEEASEKELQLFGCSIQVKPKSMVYKYGAVMHGRPKIATQSFVKKIRQEEVQQEVFNVNKIMSVQEFGNNIEISFIEDFIPKIKKRENKNEWVVNTRSKRVHNGECTRTVDIGIIGLEPSLARVLTALGDEYHRGKIKDHYGERIGIIHTSQYGAVICSARRKLLNEDKSEASLFDQSQETITAIALLLGWGNEYNEMENGRIA